MSNFGHVGIYPFIRYRSIIESLCEKYYHKDCIILDAGCGPDGGSLPNSSNRVSIVALDVNKRCVVKSHRKAKNLYVVRADISHLPFKSDTFSLVVCIDVLEHLRKHEPAIMEMHRVSKLRAPLIGSTSNLMNPLMFFDSFVPKILMKRLVAMYAGDHHERYRRLTPTALEKKMRQGGYVAMRLLMTSFPPFQRWIHEDMGTKQPWFSHLWAVFDTITKHKPLFLLKGNMVFEFHS